MRKILKTIGVVFGFLGIATLAVFFLETTGNANFGLPQGNLTADISANNPLDAPAVPPPDQLADVGASVDAGAGVDAVVATDTQAVAPPTDIPPADATASLPLPPETPAPPPAQEAAPAAPPQFITQGNINTTSTVTTATITVTQIAPPPPLSLQQTTAKSPAPGNLALPFSQSVFPGNYDWQTVWGTMNATWSNSMQLSAGAGSLGGAVYLKNSTGWSDYAMDTTLDWTGGRTIGLMADYNDASNYVLCEYSKFDPDTITMRLLQYVNGHDILLAPATSVSWNGDSADLDLSIKVAGVYGSCSFNGQTISNSTIAPGNSLMASSGSGGIGFTVSDPAPDTSEIIVRHVNVSGE